MRRRSCSCAAPHRFVEVPDSLWNAHAGILCTPREFSPPIRVVFVSDLIKLRMKDRCVLDSESVLTACVPGWCECLVHFVEARSGLILEEHLLPIMND